MNKILPVIFLLASFSTKAQKIESIFINLYTDSLKKGTHNYINVDGLLSNGKYLPLDSTHILFTASAGKFFGNTLLIDKNFTGDSVSIKTVLKKTPTIYKEFVIYIKKKNDDENLKTVEQLLNEDQPTKAKRKKG